VATRTWDVDARSTGNPLPIIAARCLLGRTRSSTSTTEFLAPTRSLIALIPLAELFKLRWAVNRRMHGLVYEYEVDPARITWFEETYGPNGGWAGFFGDGAGYLGSELLRDAMRPGRYLVIDRWASAEDAARFLADRAEEYERRSTDTAHLYLHEVRLGAFDVVTAG
jgi:heme-degrading monooxygenase HmoA